MNFTSKYKFVAPRKVKTVRKVVIEGMACQLPSITTFLKRQYISTIGDCPVWQYGLWSFQTGGTKLGRFLPKNQHPQRKLLDY